MGPHSDWLFRTFQKYWGVAIGECLSYVMSTMLLASIEDWGYGRMH